MRKQLVNSDRQPLYGSIEEGFEETDQNMASLNGLEVDKESEKKLKYPKSVFFIISNEFCERFSYYGMRTVLALYLSDALKYDDNTSTIIYHVFVMLCYFTPMFGGIMADAWLGKFKTILYVSILYATGNVVLSFASVESISIPHKELSILGLLLIAIGTGGIKPCVSSFGGDQFVLPQQERQLQSFFSVFYFSINAGSVISSFLTPQLREFHCLGSTNSCYPLAFGLPAALMIVAICVFVCGSPMYKRIKPQGNITIQIAGCVTAAIGQKIKSKDKREHWLDYADHKYSPRLIADIKVLMKLIYLFSPTIVFWALFEQQGSKWTFQAKRMDGDIGWYVIQPDQMQTLNAVLILIFIPLFDSIIYPLLAKLRLIRTPLQKLCVGGFLAALAFVASGILELKIQNEISVLPSNGHAELHLYNSLQAQNCQIHVDGIIKAEIPPFSFKVLPALDIKTGDIKVSCPNELSQNIVLKNQEISSYLIKSEGQNETSLLQLSINEASDMVKDSKPKIRIIYENSNGLELILQQGDYSVPVNIVNGAYQSKQILLDSAGKYSVMIGDKKIEEFKVAAGGIYAFMIIDSSNNMEGKLFTLSEPYSLSILWQIPQYIIITSAEILFSITGLEFSYSQSPTSLKSVISSLWLLTDALGNIIILFIEGFKMSNVALEMFIYAAVMSVSMIIFTIMAIRYKYVTPSQEEESPDEEQTRI